MKDHRRRAADRSARRHGAATMVFHPWEVTERPTPGALSGFAAFVHETGRLGYRKKIEHLLASCPWQPVGQLVRMALDGEPAGDEPAGEAA